MTSGNIAMHAAETNLLKLLQGSKVFLVPNFQRRYSWRRAEWEQLWDDLLRECRRTHDSDAQALDGHFLGSVVLHPAPGGASVLMKHLVVDGQQRLTTVLILLAAMRDVGESLQVEGWNPEEYNVKYLVNAYDDTYKDRLVPTKLDRKAYEQTVRHRVPTEGIGQAYSFFAKSIKAAVNDPDEEARIPLKLLADTLLLHMLVVEINTTPGDSVNNIFNRLNSKGMQLSPADLVRNELLLNLDEAQADAAYEQFWMPMEGNLVKLKSNGNRDDRKFVTFLWAREVVFEPSTTQSSLFLTFEKRFRDALRDLPPADRAERAMEIFEEIHADHLLFVLMQDPLNAAYDSSPVGKPLRQALERLGRWGSDPCIPLALWLLKSASNGSIEEHEAVSAIDAMLSYLVRRALAGIPTNQLNRLITPIANQLASRGDKPLHARLIEILSLPGYHWPSDPEVMGAVAKTPLYLSARKQVNYLLTMVERILEPLEQVDTSTLTIEHVLPQSVLTTPGWTEYLEGSSVQLGDAVAVIHTLGNLTLVAGPYNSEMSNRTFELKRTEFGESPLRINNVIAHHSSWLPQDIEARSSELAGLLLAALPGPSTSPPAPDPMSLEDDQLDKLEDILQSLPDEGWTTEVALQEFLGLSVDEVRALVNRLGPEVARLVRDKSGGIPDWLTADIGEAVLSQTFEASSVKYFDAVKLGKLNERGEQVADGIFDPDDSEPDETSPW
ncbi:DUF262 domain-containing HNH endonuclease family protein [Aeromicrobium sp. NPDC092404]|uniref:DUF262 domain-containing protein n=1 Tax=Aeromicrobium sp. NPDC092404 TaxID=3154976 RepID=UPI00343CCCCE